MISDPIAEPDLFKPSVVECEEAIALLLKADSQTLEAACTKSHWSDRVSLGHNISQDRPGGWGA